MRRVGVRSLASIPRRSAVSVLRTNVLYNSSVTATYSSSYSTESTGPLKTTALHAFHVSKNAHMVPFCGWDMPLEYPDLHIKDSHVHTRKAASIFDVSHMGQLRITGKDRIPFIETLVVGDIAALKEGHAQLSVFTNEKGGIKDDTMITSNKDYLYIVVNAGCAEKDIAHLTEQLASYKKKGKDVQMEVIKTHSLIAIQGPKAAAAFSQHVKEDLSKVLFMTGLVTTVAGIKDCRVTRCGYTGEDGFEVSVPHEHAATLTKKLLENPDVKLAGLAARDSLRLDCGLCLYGNDIDETTTPVEAGLNWLIGKRRRKEGGFLGANVILDQLKNGVSRKRIGFTMKTGIARAHNQILLEGSDKEIGEVTSGGWSPTTGKGIGMAYIKTEYAKKGTPAEFVVKKKKFPGTIEALPIVPTSFYKPS